MEVSQLLTKAANNSCYALEQLELMLTRLRQHHNPIRHFEGLLWESIKVPEEAVTVGASLDGVMLPRRLSENSARSEDGRKFRIKIPFCEVNSGSICRTKRNF